MLLLVRLILFHLIFFKPPVPALNPIINTSLHTGVLPSAFRQARITPLLKKPTLNPSLFIAKTLEQFVFNQVSAFLIQNNSIQFKIICIALTTSSTATSLVSEVDVHPRLPCSHKYILLWNFDHIYHYNFVFIYYFYLFWQYTNVLAAQLNYVF